MVANFSPRIQPDVNLTADRRGFVQFTITFYNASVGNGFTQVLPISNLVFVHYDNDGNGNATSWFRETGVAQQIAPGNPTVLAGGGTTELAAYSYTTQTQNNSTFTWTGFAGSVCERSNISKCAEVAEAYRYGNTPISSLTFRLGYDNKGNTNQRPIRQYGARFTCFGPSPATLPVSITNFSVSHRDGIATLLWTTTDEDKFKKFEIERSVAGKNFFNVSDVAFRGASRTTTDYEFADDIRNVSGTTVFYRLRMVDADEKFSFSNIVSVRRGFSGGKLNISPNPATSNVVVRFESLTSGMAELTISDISDRIVWRKNNQVLRGSNNITIPEISGLTEGVYQIRIVHNGESKIDQLVIKR
ncbi:MAG: T9SS type A sorting domain-containing protein [Chitinophagaceae bacterium]|nr:T9SS type A sorting domain-containing protein [Chitinophagaceae bacterium]